MEFKEQEEALNEWLKDRPEIIKQMAEKFKPWFNYRLKPTGQHCYLRSYLEDGTVTIVVNGHDDHGLNLLNQMLPHGVFGIDPNDLEVIEDQEKSDGV